MNGYQRSLKLPNFDPKILPDMTRQEVSSTPGLSLPWTQQGPVASMMEETPLSQYPMELCAVKGTIFKLTADGTVGLIKTWKGLVIFNIPVLWTILIPGVPNLIPRLIRPIQEKSMRKILKDGDVVFFNAALMNKDNHYPYIATDVWSEAGMGALQLYQMPCPSIQNSIVCLKTVQDIYSNLIRCPEFSGSKSEQVLCCFTCQGNHTLPDCPRFISQSPGKRNHTAGHPRVCTTCLLSVHLKETCKSKNKTCGINNCDKTHHPLLHIEHKPESRAAVVPKNQKSTLEPKTVKNDILDKKTLLQAFVSGGSNQSTCFFCFCQGDHQLPNCPKFLEMSNLARGRFIKNNKICQVCLQTIDQLETCCKSEKQICGFENCKQIHHRLFHSTSEARCPKCKGNHFLPECPSFLGSDMEMRRIIVRKNKVCECCLVTEFGPSESQKVCIQCCGDISKSCGINPHLLLQKTKKKKKKKRDKQAQEKEQNQEGEQEVIQNKDSDEKKKSSASLPDTARQEVLFNKSEMSTPETSMQLTQQGFLASTMEEAPLWQYPKELCAVKGQIYVLSTDGTVGLIQMPKGLVIFNISVLWNILIPGVPNLLPRLIRPIQEKSMQQILRRGDNVIFNAVLMNKDNHYPYIATDVWSEAGMGALQFYQMPCPSIQNSVMCWTTVKEIYLSLISCPEFSGSGSDKVLCCFSCQGDHTLPDCPKFIRNTPEVRSCYVGGVRVCTLCLLSVHVKETCKSKNKICDMNNCNKRHHPLLHIQNKPESKEAVVSKTVQNWVLNKEMLLKTYSRFISGGLNQSMFCFLCQGDHQLPNCPKFLEMSKTAKKKFTKNNKICQICLQTIDQLETCCQSERQICSIANCNQIHHILFHSTSLKAVESNDDLCLLCKDSHKLEDCDSFLLKTLDDRLEFVVRNKLCDRCLSDHGISNCPRTKDQTCGIGSCQDTHHSLLHHDAKKGTQKREDKQEQEGTQNKDSTEKKKSSARCPMCSGNHFLPECSSFLESDLETRQIFVRKRKLCHCCLVTEFGPSERQKVCLQCSGDVSKSCGIDPHPLIRQTSDDESADFSGDVNSSKAKMLNRVHGRVFKLSVSEKSGLIMTDDDQLVLFHLSDVYNVKLTDTIPTKTNLVKWIDSTGETTLAGRYKLF
jgi:hypothetical protein